MNGIEGDMIHGFSEDRERTSFLEFCLDVGRETLENFTHPVKDGIVRQRKSL